MIQSGAISSCKFGRFILEGWTGKMWYSEIVLTCGFLLSTHSARVIEHIVTGSTHRYDHNRTYNLDKSRTFPYMGDPRVRTYQDP